MSKKKSSFRDREPHKPMRFLLNEIDWMFVHRPELPQPPELVELLKLVETWPKEFSAYLRWCDWYELESEKVGSVGRKDFFKRESLKENPGFLTLGEFLSQYRPITQPFAITSTNWSKAWTRIFAQQWHQWYPNSPEDFEEALNDDETGLSGVGIASIRSQSLSRIESALCGDLPMPFIGGGGHSFLFGDSVWEVDDNEKGILRTYSPKTGPYDLAEIKSVLLGKRVSIEGDKTSRTSIPERVRMFVWRRDEGRCVECGSNENLEFDHIIPVSKGGSSTERNVQLLCEPCNRKKSDR